MGSGHVSSNEVRKLSKSLVLFGCGFVESMRSSSQESNASAMLDVTHWRNDRVSRFESKAIDRTVVTTDILDVLAACNN